MADYQQYIQAGAETGSAFITGAFDKAINKDNNKTAKAIAETQSKTEIEIAKINADTERLKIEAQQSQSNINAMYGGAVVTATAAATDAPQVEGNGNMTLYVVLGVAGLAIVMYFLSTKK